jgi:hypothetical protein
MKGYMHVVNESGSTSFLVRTMWNQNSVRFLLKFCVTQLQSYPFPLIKTHLSLILIAIYLYSHVFTGSEWWSRIYRDDCGSGPVRTGGLVYSVCFCNLYSRGPFFVVTMIFAVGDALSQLLTGLPPCPSLKILPVRI